MLKLSEIAMNSVPPKVTMFQLLDFDSRLVQDFPSCRIFRLENGVSVLRHGRDEGRITYLGGGDTGTRRI